MWFVPEGVREHGGSSGGHRSVGSEPERRLGEIPARRTVVRWRRRPAPALLMSF